MQPPWPDPGHATAADLAACREALREGSRTFFAASLLLPPGVREPATALYAFCRLADDAVDLGGGGGRRLDALAHLRERLDRAYAGRPVEHPVDRALADVVAGFAVPKALLDGLLEGFEWDAAGRRYEDLSELHAYAARVAGTVGAMMAVLMGARDPAVVARACDLGVAMQLSNIARDVGEDARAGRLYLPRRWLREVGIDPEAWLARPAHGEALGFVVQRLLGAADLLYERADAGVAALPLPCRPGIQAARLLYREIGREVERRGLDSVRQRAVVPASRKLSLLARAVAASAIPRESERVPPLEEVRFLVEAVAAAPAWPAKPMPWQGSWWNAADRVIWVVELFERLERRKQIAGSAGTSQG